MKNISAGDLSFHTTQKDVDPLFAEAQSPCVESELIACIEALSEHDLLVLQRYAEFLMAGVRGRIFDADADDLMQEAIERLLAGRRKWNPEEVGFVKLFKGCMRSIVNGWYKKSKDTESTDQCDSKSKEHAKVEASITIEKARHRLDSDPLAQSVFDLLKEGYSGVEIQEVLKITLNDYNATTRRIYRRLEQARRGTTNA